MPGDEVIPPWLKPEAFPAKPEEHPYGFIERGKMMFSSRDGLISLCHLNGFPLVKMAWSPETERIVPVEELPFLQEALRARMRKSIRSSVGFAAFGLVVYGLPILLGSSHDKRITQYRLLPLLMFAVIPLAQGFWSLWKLRHENAEDFERLIPSARYAGWLAQQRRPCSWILTALIVGLFVLQLMTGLEKSIQLGGLTKTGLQLHDGYRFLTAALLHGSVMHVLMNGFTLFYLGAVVEALAGSARLAVIFLLSALGGTVFSYFAIPQTSVGASGGIMGLIGFLGVLGFRLRHLLPPKFGLQMVQSVALMALIGVVAHDVIDNAAHAGGLLTGAGLGWFFSRGNHVIPLPPSQLVRQVGWISLLILFAAAGLLSILFFRS